MINKILLRMRSYLDDGLVLVYQFGKVGSTAVSGSVEKSLNVHDLYGNVMCPPGFKLRNSLLYRFFFPFERCVRRLILRSRKEVLIIVPLRLPYERNISMFFQDLPFWYVDYFSKNKGYAKGEGVGILLDVFEKRFPHNSCDEWFEREFSKFTGIKLEDIEFDKSAGFGYAEKGKFKCLFLYHEKIRTSLGREKIELFCGQRMKVVDANRGSEKWYSGAYSDFLSQVDFVERYKEKMSLTKVHRKFY